MLPTVASASGINPPAPSPWTARKTTSSGMFWDNPQSAEPTRKIVIAIRINGRRPWMSPSFP